MKFWKLHGIGNDFIVIDQRFNQYDECEKIAKKVCNRKFSVGADGLLIVKESNIADVKMLYYNSDGSIASMCGNGLRCFAKYVYDNEIVVKENLKIETLDGIKEVNINKEDNITSLVKVNMGSGSFLCKNISMIHTMETFLEQKVKVKDKEFIVSSMLMGVPHTVVFVDDIDLNDVHKYGNEIEKNKMFLKGTNVNFVKIEDNNNIKVATWERGCGYTLGCGTGMTASAVIGNFLRKLDKNVYVTSQGGCVKIDINEDCIYMTGPAVKICEGILEV
ncbi:diaminopimelate epimerase [Romboutsia sp. 1001713B170131_170501_G6]|uniref:diaminopimelate epimerase n=1 Tax=Romboutsia sp. 1001713B170131_170501_G6 TaxID=2787108 RepID=UPI0018A8DEEE|nr:diaminopimelate epimerase [Romboutsia sp. 1001713B170131_170501_G6]